MLFQLQNKPYQKQAVVSTVGLHVILGKLDGLAARALILNMNNLLNIIKDIVNAVSVYLLLGLYAYFLTLHLLNLNDLGSADGSHSVHIDEGGSRLPKTVSKMLQ